MINGLKKTQKNLEQVSDVLAKIKEGDIQSMGILLNSLAINSLKSEDENYKPFEKIRFALTEYSKKLILDERTDTGPVIKGIALLNNVLKHSISKKRFELNINTELEKLEYEKEMPRTEENTLANENTKSTELEIFEGVKKISEEDIPIIYDFITEAGDNLDTIEINLVSLEGNPNDTDIIDDIFRPFHTIKGVAGFLDLKKINRLSHVTENLLDCARKGNISINNKMTDIILNSVDILKKLLNCTSECINTGMVIDDDDISVNQQIELIEKTIGYATAEFNKEKELTDDKLSPLGEILVKSGNVNIQDLETGLEIQKKHPSKKIGEILVEERFIDQKDVNSALREQRNRKQGTHQVKVDTAKLDNLVDLTGEIVIAQSMLKQNSLELNAGQKFNQNMIQLGQIVSNLQKIAMSMRMVPIKTTFMKMIRLVRDLSRSCKKEIKLDMFGEDTEIDRNVVEALYEPMVHMIRNSVDHGLESVSERKNKKKCFKGTITLRAYHKSGNIVIEISDDGRGLNREKILEKAIQAGLIKADTVLSDSEIDNLILEPGFSTSDAVTDISGRGVGMDVVVKAIESLSGTLEILSEPGKRSTFLISLPLTLAIIDGMLMRVGSEKYIIPTLSILESFKPKNTDYHTVQNKGEMVRVREDLIPLVRIAEFCGLNNHSDSITEGLVVVVENKEKKLGLYLDEVIGKEEFVIKNLGDALKDVKGLAGGAILSDGSVGLILDIASLFDFNRN